MPMTPAEMERLSKGVEEHMEELAAAVLAEIIERIKAGREITSTTDYLIYRYSCIKGFTQAVKEHIRKAIGASEDEIDHIFDDVMREQYVRDAAIYKELADRELTPYEDNAELRQYIQAVKAQTKESFENITRTGGYMVKVNGKMQMTPPAAVLQRSLDRAVGQVLEGTETYNNAIRDIVKELTDSGLRTVNYDSGKTYDVASAARMCVMTGATQVVGQVAVQQMRDLGTPYVEVSWHATARPSHQVWQGRVFYWKEKDRAGEMARRKIGEQGQEIIDKATFNKLVEKFKKSGGLLIQGEEAEEYLKKRGATAAYIVGANTAIISDNPTISDVLEEMYHAEQDRTGIYSECDLYEMKLRREIDAQNYLLNMAERYKIPEEEIKVTRANLAMYEEQLNKLLNGGG